MLVGYTRSIMIIKWRAAIKKKVGKGRGGCNMGGKKISGRGEVGHGKEHKMMEMGRYEERDKGRGTTRWLMGS